MRIMRKRVGVPGAVRVGYVTKKRAQAVVDELNRAKDGWVYWMEPPADGEV